MPAFPNMLTENTPVSVLQPGAPAFDWTDQDFERPAKSSLVIYELLVRDFTDERNYQTILDTLDYLDRLGINAIEFMPVNEFNGNDSWGYNPTFYLALDKAYGDKSAFKELVNACHERGIAVLLDVVLNHADYPNPFLKMYWNASSFQPAANNPWFNECRRVRKRGSSIGTTTARHEVFHETSVEVLGENTTSTATASTFPRA